VDPDWEDELVDMQESKTRGEENKGRNAINEWLVVSFA